MRRPIALKDNATAPTALTAVPATTAPAVAAAAIWHRVVVKPGFCRQQSPEKIRTNFSRQWTGPDSRRVAMEAAVVVAEVVEVAGIGGRVARRVQGSHNPVAMEGGSNHPDAGMTGLIEMTEGTERSVARAQTSPTP